MTRKKRVRADQAPTLDLTLTTATIPPEVFEKPWLTSLTIRGGTLKAVSPRLAELKNLTSLVLDKQPKLDLSALPVMPKLEHLALRSCKLKALPESLFGCRALRVLSLGNNPLKVAPPALGTLRNLEMLYLWGCQLRSVPETLGELKALRTLELEKNELRELPDSLSKLLNLEELLLEKNAFTSFPEVVCRLPKLRRLELYANQLSALPAAVNQLAKLQRLRLEDNPLARFPQDLSGLAALETLYLSIAITKDQLKEQVRKLPPKAFVMAFGLGDIARDGRWADLPARSSSELRGGTNAEERVFHHKNRVTAVAFVRGGVAGAGYDALRVFDLSTGKERFSQPGDVTSVAASPDGSLLAVLRNADVLLLDAVAGTERDRIPLKLVERVSWSRDGSVILLTTKEALHFYAAKTLKAVEVLRESGARFAALSHDGTRALYGVQKSVRVWDREAKKEVLRVSVDRFGVHHGAFSDDGAEIVVAGYEPRITRLALGTKKPKPVLTVLAEPAQSMVLLPGGRVAVAGPKVRVIELDSGEEVVTLGAHEAVGPVDDLALSPDGSLVASCGCDKTIRVWRLPAE